MTKRDQVTLFECLEMFYKEVNCNKDCENCEYAIGVENGYCGYVCPMLCMMRIVYEKCGVGHAV